MYVHIGHAIACCIGMLCVGVISFGQPLWIVVVFFVVVVVVVCLIPVYF